MTSSLAVLGGTPTIEDPTPHFQWPPMNELTRNAVLAQLGDTISIYDRSGVIADLEDALAAYFGSQYAVLTSSGTAGLYSMYAACGLSPGDEVIVPAYTFFATATPLLHLGVVPVLADCDPTGNLDPRELPRHITEKTKAIVVTHMWGLPAQVQSLAGLAEVYGLQLLEDGSHAHGAGIDNRKVGTFGRAAAFSMNGPKPLSAGEGGFVLTDDEHVYYRVLLHGQFNKRCRTEIPEHHALHRYAVTGMGLKHRIHPLAATIALNQLAHLDEYLTGRCRIAAHMADRLDGLPGITAPRPGPEVRPSWYGMALQYRGDELGGLPIERVHQALLAEGCGEVDRPGSTCPLNLLELFQSPGTLFPQHAGEFAYQPGEFPQAEHLYQHTIKLPVWHREQDLPVVDLYLDAIEKVIHNADKLKG
ncbi:DegT/DnrJ/EryC1/StrS family aminotransferase [Nocardia cyriacigeorgica]|uniref:DegT/DnrJ/EryC1/StrS family aminotransferase n=1 Tax=Nocardia cyriacigeorgica TaxID=135487 RepID=UPI000CEB42BA|nr:DegT/DnrJ/EryC1/StrS family aminotransferase [Nocardia cyriacigeorgica]AVH23446.1 cell wall biogenesis protein [Nocardia cyriacigeorgica]